MYIHFISTMLRHFRLLARAKRRQVLETNALTKQEPNMKKLPYQDFLKICRWQNYRNPKNTK